MCASKVQQQRGASLATEEPFTTLMLRRLPLDMTTTTLVEMLSGLAPGKFDFVYVPHDRRKKINIALAFINFVDATSARNVCEHVLQMNARKLWTITACAGNVQSLQFNLAYYLARFGMASIYDVNAPLLFKDGVKIEDRGEIRKAYDLPHEVQQDIL